jgi:hypothetical protein
MILIKAKHFAKPYPKEKKLDINDLTTAKSVKSLHSSVVLRLSRNSILSSGSTLLRAVTRQAFTQAKL